MKARAFFLTLSLVAALTFHLHRSLHRVSAEGEGPVVHPPLLGLMFGDTVQGGALDQEDDGTDDSRRKDTDTETAALDPRAKPAGQGSPRRWTPASLRDALSAGPPRDAAWLSLRERALAQVREAAKAARTGKERRDSPLRACARTRARANEGELEPVPALREDEPASGPAGDRRGPRTRRRGRRPWLEALDKGEPAPPREEPDFDGSFRVAPGAAWMDFFGDGLRAPRGRRAGREAGKGKPSPARYPRTSLKGWLGKRPLKPPTGALKPPDFERVRKKYPAALPGGGSFERADPAPVQSEELDTPEEAPEYKAWLEEDRRSGVKGKPHWHRGSDGALTYHVARAWGRPLAGRWGWLLRGSGHWWTLAEGGQALVGQGGRWWWRTRDGWFLLHGGEPWAWRWFAGWERYGLFHTTSGTRVVYSADNARLAVVTPGWGAAVFDARTGSFLGNYPYP